jgi:hypothetical protein
MGEFEELFENQRKYPNKDWSGQLLPGERAPYSDRKGTRKKSKDMALPEGWSWDGDWAPEVNEEVTDGGGWIYGINFASLDNGGRKTPKWTDLVRRRRWLRCREKSASADASLGEFAEAGSSSASTTSTTSTTTSASTAASSANSITPAAARVRAGSVTSAHSDALIAQLKKQMAVMEYENSKLKNTLEKQKADTAQKDQQLKDARENLDSTKKCFEQERQQYELKLKQYEVVLQQQQEKLDSMPENGGGQTEEQNTEEQVAMGSGKKPPVARRSMFGFGKKKKTPEKEKKAGIAGLTLRRKSKESVPAPEEESVFRNGTKPSRSHSASEATSDFQSHMHFETSDYSNRGKSEFLISDTADEQDHLSPAARDAMNSRFSQDMATGKAAWKFHDNLASFGDNEGGHDAATQALLVRQQHHQEERAREASEEAGRAQARAQAREKQESEVEAQFRAERARDDFKSCVSMEDSSADEGEKSGGEGAGLGGRKISGRGGQQTEVEEFGSDSDDMDEDDDNDFMAALAAGQAAAAAAAAAAATTTTTAAAVVAAAAACAASERASLEAFKQQAGADTNDAERHSEASVQVAKAVEAKAVEAAEARAAAQAHALAANAKAVAAKALEAVAAAAPQQPPQPVSPPRPAPPAETTQGATLGSGLEKKGPLLAVVAAVEQRYVHLDMTHRDEIDVYINACCVVYMSAIVFRNC